MSQQRPDDLLGQFGGLRLDQNAFETRATPGQSQGHALLHMLPQGKQPVGPPGPGSLLGGAHFEVMGIAVKPSK